MVVKYKEMVKNSTLDKYSKTCSGCGKVIEKKGDLCEECKTINTQTEKVSK